MEEESKGIKQNLSMLLTKQKTESHYLVWIGWAKLFGQNDTSKRRGPQPTNQEKTKYLHILKSFSNEPCNQRCRI